MVSNLFDSHRPVFGTFNENRQTGALEGQSELGFLARVAEPAQPGPAKALRIPADRLSATHRDDGDTLPSEVPAVSLGQRLQCDPVACPLHEDDGPHSELFT